MIAEINRRNIDPDNEPISILEASVDPNAQRDVIENPEVNFKSMLMENEDPDFAGKKKLRVFPNYMGINLNIDTDFIQLADSTVVEKLIIDPPVLEVTDSELKTLDPVVAETPAEKRVIEQPTTNDPGAAEICAEPSTAVSSNSAPFAAEPSDAEPSAIEPETGEQNPDEPISNKPTPAKIILPPAPPPAAAPVAALAAEEISDDSDDPGDEDERREQIKSRRSRILCTFFTFWGVNALICFLAYGSIFYPGPIRAIFESKPHYYPLVLIPHEKWTTEEGYMAVDKKKFVAKRVTVVQTDTKDCDNFEECLNLLVGLERNEGKLPYNFVLSSAGDIFESRGWNEASPLFPEMPTMVVAFIGDYDKKEPSTKQLNQFKALLSTSQHIKNLDSSYKINGRKIKKLPTKLFQTLNDWKEYDITNSDTEYVSIDFDPQVLDKD